MMLWRNRSFKESKDKISTQVDMKLWLHVNLIHQLMSSIVSQIFHPSPRKFSHHQLPISLNPCNFPAQTFIKSFTSKNRWKFWATFPFPINHSSKPRNTIYLILMSQNFSYQESLVFQVIDFSSLVEQPTFNVLVPINKLLNLSRIQSPERDPKFIEQVCINLGLALEFLFIQIFHKFS